MNEQVSMTKEELLKNRYLNGRETLTIDELLVLMEYEDEFSRKGNFARIFPLASNVDYYE